jgi:hypothetical protein
MTDGTTRFPEPLFQDSSHTFIPRTPDALRSAAVAARGPLHHFIEVAPQNGCRMRAMPQPAQHRTTSAFWIFLVCTLFWNKSVSPPLRTYGESEQTR